LVISRRGAVLFIVAACYSGYQKTKTPFIIYLFVACCSTWSSTMDMDKPGGGSCLF